MRKLYAALLCSVCAAFSSAQTHSEDAAFVAQARAKYDAPFTRGLKSFECAVDFNWKEHRAETYRVGDEGTDEEIQKFVQPIANRVIVTSDDAQMSSGMTAQQESKLPRGGMAEGLLKHAVRFALRTWLVASNDNLLPSPGTPVHVERVPSSFTINLKMSGADVAMQLTRDMGLQSMAATASKNDRQEFEFRPGPQGFVLASWTMGEDGDFKPGNRLIFTYTYQTIDGFQIPMKVSINRESHHEVWHYSLSGCKVTRDK